MKKLLCYYTKTELILWGASTALILASFTRVVSDRTHYVASLLAVPFLPLHLRKSFR